ncbi:MAG: isopenicillin N synthase family oxygenase [Alphaproteobacteria bacterium]|nr:isopenicillin N synthase family oxygenase [Alphaproteobacteria bacterium]
MGIRTLSLADWTSLDPSRRARFVRELGLGLEEHGFVAIAEPGLEPELLRQAYAMAEALFALPEAEKRRHEHPEIGRQRGYTPFGTEHAKDQITADLKEFWHVGRETSVEDGLPANDFPSEPDAGPVFTALFAALERVAGHMLDAIGLYLGQHDGYFAELTDHGNSVLRVIHYPPLPESVPVGAVRAAAHEDINLMTVLPVSTSSGLEIQLPDGSWMPVDAEPETVIVDTGDMMALLTGGRLPATTHRVVNPTEPTLARRARYSLPFFVHPRPAARLTPFDANEPGPTAAEFLHDRLVAIGIAG